MSTDVVVLTREIDGFQVGQRKGDGFLNATALCKAAGKLWADYRRLGTTEAFFDELARSMGIPIDLLVLQTLSGPNELRGTWVHPDVAIHLAQWCSPKFAVAVSCWVRELLTTGRVELVSTGDPLLDSIERIQAATAAIAETRRKQLDLERQQAETHALATCAQRTATAALHQSTANLGHFAVLAYARLTGRELTIAQAQAHGRRLSSICRQRGLHVGQMTDPRFGRVNTYPESLLQEYFEDGAPESIPLG